MPVDLAPVRLAVGSCTGPNRRHRLMDAGGRVVRHLLCLLGRFAELSRDERPVGSLLAFARGDIAFSAQPLSAPLQDGFRFLRLPLPATPWARLTARLPSSGGLRAYHVPSRRQGWFRPRLSAGGHSVHDGDGTSPRTRPLTFWSKPVSIFGLLQLTAFISDSHMVAMPSNPCALTASMLAVIASPRGSATTLAGVGSLSQGLRTAGLLQPHALVGY